MCDTCNWENLLETISEMLDDERYEFAIDTIEGIQDWVLDNEHCTENQETAIKNMKESVGDT